MHLTLTTPLAPCLAPSLPRMAEAARPPQDPKARFWSLQHPPAAAQAAVKAFKARPRHRPVTTPRRIMEHNGRPGSQTFVGATLAGCITITQPLLEGGFGRGYIATWADQGSGCQKKVFVKTFGTDFTNTRFPNEERELDPIRLAEYKDFDRSVQLEAEVYTHPWLPAVLLA